MVQFAAQVGGGCVSMAAAWAAIWPVTRPWSATVPATWLVVNIGAGLAAFVLVLRWLGNAELRLAMESLSAKLRGPWRGARGGNG